MSNTIDLSFSDKKPQVVLLDKITSRIRKQCYGLKMEFVDPVGIEMDPNRELKSSNRLFRIPILAPITKSTASCVLLII